jgi:hypothetical protein
MERARLVVFAALLSAALAHSIQYPKRDRLRLSTAQIRLDVDYSISDEDARALREILRKPITDYLVQQATHFAVLTVDGVAVKLVVQRVTPMEAGVHVELAAAVARPHHVRFEDRHKDRRITVPVEVVLDGLQLASPLPPQPFVFADHPLEMDLK